MIIFNSEIVDIPALDFPAVESWIKEVAAAHGFTVGRLSYLFVDDETILDQNRKFLNHDFYTDIITFDYTHRNRVSGDMIISLDTVRSNSEMVGESYGRELLRVSFMASCTSAESTTKDRVKGKSWKCMRTMLWLSSLLPSLLLYNSTISFV